MARIRFLRADQGDSDCTPASDGNKPMLATKTDGNETTTAVIVAQTMNQLAFSFSMAAGDPGGEEDLGAASAFSAELDLSVMDASLSCVVQFHALNASCVSQGSVSMDQADFTGTGVKVATASWDPPIADRYQVRVIVSTSEGHSGANQTITIRTNNADSEFSIPDAP